MSTTAIVRGSGRERIARTAGIRGQRDQMPVLSRSGDAPRGVVGFDPRRETSMLRLSDLLLAVVGATLALVPIAITVQGWYGVHRRVDTLAHATAGASLAAFSLALLAAPPLAHVALVTGIAVGWELVEPRLHWVLPIERVDNTGPQDTEADIAVVGFAAALTVLLLG